MKKFAVIAAAFGCIAAPAFAQDSVATTPCLPGDALNPYAPGDQCAQYVVDLTTLTSSWSRDYLTAPIVKSSQPSEQEFLGSLISAQAISRLQAAGVQAPAMSYDEWVNMPGFGVDYVTPPMGNMMPGSVMAPAATNQMAYSFNEFSDNYQGNVAGFINYDPADNSRLYVTRTLAASNGCSTAENGSQFGGCSIDELGNLDIRVDDFGVTTGCNGLASGQNIYLFNVRNRNCQSLNVIGAGSSDIGVATANADWIVRSSGTTHTVPQVIPASQTGGAAVYTGPKFDTFLNYGSTFGGIISTAAHRTGSSDQRGSVGYTSYNPGFLGASTAGTCGIYVKDAAGDTTVISIWGLTAAGAPTANMLLPLPAGIMDQCGGHTVASPFELAHYHSQTAFRGGVGQVALGRDADRNLVVAATVTDGNTDDVTDWGANSVVVRRLNTAGAAVGPWNLAAWIDSTTGIGKEYLDGPGGTPVGRLLALGFITGGAPAGPSITSPGIDASGNIYFLAAFQQYVGTVDQPAEPIDDRFSVGLFRANYDKALDCFELELMMAVGDSFPGLNSGRDYLISFMGIADSDSISSGSFFSNNVSESAAGNADPNAIADPISTETLGGLVVNVEITYDYDQDGNFDGCTGSTPFGPNDPEYNVLMFVSGAAGEAPDDCPEDIDGNGQVDSTDLAILLSNFGTTMGATKADGDIDGDGDVDSTDLAILLGVFGATCPTV